MEFALCHLLAPEVLKYLLGFWKSLYTPGQCCTKTAAYDWPPPPSTTTYFFSRRFPRSFFFTKGWKVFPRICPMHLLVTQTQYLHTHSMCYTSVAAERGLFQDSLHSYFLLYLYVKVKFIPQQTEIAQGVPGRLRPPIFLTFGTTRVVGRQPYAPAAFTPGEIPGTHFQGLNQPQGTWFRRGEPLK